MQRQKNAVSILKMMENVLIFPIKQVQAHLDSPIQNET